MVNEGMRYPDRRGKDEVRRLGVNGVRSTHWTESFPALRRFGKTGTYIHLQLARTPLHSNDSHSHLASSCPVPFEFASLVRPLRII